jgi:hypothetical protein
VPAPPVPPPPPPGTEGTLKLPAAHEGMGGTLPLGSDLSAHMRPALPFAEATTGGGASPFSHWTVSAYASLCAELRDAPAHRTDAILAKFGVPDGLVRTALQNYWQHVFAADPAKRDEFKRLLPVYLEYVRTGQG